VIGINRFLEWVTQLKPGTVFMWIVVAFSAAVAVLVILSFILAMFGYYD
jgi:hypothetical protein